MLGGHHSSDTGLQLICNCKPTHPQRLPRCSQPSVRQCAKQMVSLIQTDVVELTQVTETAIEPWVTEAGPIEAVAPAAVSTVAFLTTMFAVEALGAACGEQFSEN